jgi:hypothetical protein
VPRPGRIHRHRRRGRRVRHARCVQRAFRAAPHTLEPLLGGPALATYPYLSAAHADFQDTTTAGIDLLSVMSCDTTALADVRVPWIYINPGTVFLDNVRAE